MDIEVVGRCGIRDSKCGIRGWRFRRRCGRRIVERDRIPFRVRRFAHQAGHGANACVFGGRKAHTDLPGELLRVGAGRVLLLPKWILKTGFLLRGRAGELRNVERANLTTLSEERAKVRHDFGSLVLRDAAPEQHDVRDALIHRHNRGVARCDHLKVGAKLRADDGVDVRFASIEPV